MMGGCRLIGRRDAAGLEEKARKGEFVFYRHFMAGS